MILMNFILILKIDKLLKTRKNNYKNNFNDFK